MLYAVYLLALLAFTYGFTVARALFMTSDPGWLHDRLLGGLPKPVDYAYPFEDDDDVEAPVRADRALPAAEDRLVTAAL